ncbi:uncharacterized protein LOC123308396 [Coccinella septempunctata]|uniref:uncharacterized protein LOC123308396 n=1 Tax=Coccinella septempunctata TaxID=41139 RepID=UPI001D084751|nr:uncharacterized protein LOC123308396 [Coccinella septempunctata]
MGDTNLFSTTQIVDPAQILSDAEIRAEEITIRRLVFETPLDAMKWCARRKLLKNTCDCDNCNIPMTCSLNSRVVLDGYQWICKLYKSQRSIRKNSFFENSELSLEQILVLVCGWAMEYPQDIISLEAQLGQGSKTVVDWYNFCREVCEVHFMQNEIVIGGLNEDCTSKTVDIDESKFFYKKYHQGRWVDGHWVFGGIERESRKCFLVEVPDRTEATLAAIIERHILPGSIIVSDGWRAYGNIQDIGGSMYEHHAIIHHENTGVFLQNLENMWMRAKYRLQRQFGTSEALFCSYLHDFVWRNQFPKSQVFAEFVIMVAAQFPVP